METKAKILTKQKMAATSMRISVRDLELMQMAARRERISQSEFLRKAIRARAERILLQAIES